MRKLKMSVSASDVGAGKRVALHVYLYFNVWLKSRRCVSHDLETGTGACTYCSSEICIIGYFLIAHNCRLMLYLRRSQINVPRDRPFGKLFPPSSCSRRFDRNTKRGVFERARNCKRFIKIYRNAVGRFVSTHQMVSASLKKRGTQA